MILPAREKPIKSRQPTDGRYPMSILCPGQGCRELLGERTPWIYGDVGLEPGYTQDLNDRYPPGEWWWRRWERPNLRGPAVREKLKNPKSMMNAMWDAERRRRFLEGHTYRRGEPYERGFLPTGEHIIICHECGGQTQISWR